MIPPTWITACLKKYNISEKVINFTTEAMRNWIVELTAGGKNFN